MLEDLQQEILQRHSARLMVNILYGVKKSEAYLWEVGSEKVPTKKFYLQKFYYVEPSLLGGTTI